MSGVTLLRDSFNQDPAQYDQARPGYPQAIVDAIVELAALPSDGTILEIGCGTGQMTLPFAARGYTILALEIGAALAAFAVQKFQAYPRVKIVNTSFEAWLVPEQPFDLVLAAQAFHWIAPDEGCAKAAAALKSGGAVALVWNLDISEDTPFWHASQPLYETYFTPSSADDTNVLLAEKTNRYKEALRRSDAFADVHEVRHAWNHVYAGADYLKLLHTYSNHRTLPEPGKTQFFQAMAEVIERSGGVVEREYETLLLLACKR
jgi:SAM-dependent methyltransferase